MALDRPGASALKIDAAHASRIFETTGAFPSISVSITGMTLAEGAATKLGGAIYFAPASAEASLTVTGSTFVDDRAGGDGTSVAQSGQGDGGAIFFEAAGKLAVTSSTFTDDTAGGNGGEGVSSAQGDGGAIYASGDEAVTVTGSSFSEDRAGGNGGEGPSSAQGDGGAIELAGEGGASTLTIAESSFNADTAGGDGGTGESSAQADGGAVADEDAALTVTTSTFDGNRAGGSAGSGNASGESYGGAMSIFGTRGATLTNDTIEGNSDGGPAAAATGAGGGALWSESPATLLNDTIDANTVIGSFGTGGNINVTSGGEVTLKNTIVSAGAAANGPNCSSGVVSAGHNLESTTPSECGLKSGLGDLIGVNPLLGPLQNNGGPTYTQALLEGSPAIEGGENEGCPATDQRGVSRPQPPGGRCDIGAFEFVPPTPAPKEPQPPGSGSTTSSVPSGIATSTPGIASTPQAIEEVLLGCTKRALVLNDVLIHNGRVLLLGSAAKALIGKKVKIIFDGKKQVATAKVGANGQFSTTAALPPANIRNTNNARYQAEEGKERSLNLKLTRRLELEPPKFSKGTVTLTGQVVPPLTKPISLVSIEQELECGRTTIAKRFTPPKSGRFKVTLSVPAAAKAGIYRLTSAVTEKPGAKHHFATFSLPLPVVLG